MNIKQYTIRNIPAPVDRYLRKRAKISGLSLNQIIIDELSDKAGVNKTNLIDSLDWFIGSKNIGKDVKDFLKKEETLQKELTKKQW